MSPADAAALVRLARETGRERAPGHSDEAWQVVRQLLWLANLLGTNRPCFVRDVRRLDRHLLDLWGETAGRRL